jgi:hypothetical protein
MPGIGRAAAGMNWWSFSPLWWLCRRSGEGEACVPVSAPRRKETLNASARTLNFPLTGGTGRFKGMTGTGVSKNIGNGDDSDVVIKLH